MSADLLAPVRFSQRGLQHVSKFNAAQSEGRAVAVGHVAQHAQEGRQGIWHVC